MGRDRGRGTFAAWIALLLIAWGAGGCANYGGGGGLGATPGGAQDIGTLRAQIAAGQVPTESALTVEGMLAEHDLPAPGSSCDASLCLQTGLAWAPVEGASASSAWVQLGFSSGIDPATFHRADLNLVLVVDRSGSMQGEKIAAARTALHQLVDRLGPRDRLAIVLFDDRVDELVGSTPVTEPAALHHAIDTIEARGSTDIEAGLARGFAIAASHASEAGRASRVMLLTDALPNRGATDPQSLEALAKRYGADGIGLTAFGVGLDFGVELVDRIAQVRGGNYYFLEDSAKLARVFDQDFDDLVTPVAYDLRVRVATASDYRLAAAYGVRDWSASTGVVTLTVPTVFLSRNRGAIVLRFEPSDAAAQSVAPHVLDATVDFARTDGTTAHAALRADFPPGAPPADASPWFAHDGVHAAVALVNWTLGVKHALAVYHGGAPADARSALASTRARFAAEVTASSDATLADDLALLDQLALNMTR